MAAALSIPIGWFIWLVSAGTYLWMTTISNVQHAEHLFRPSVAFSSTWKATHVRKICKTGLPYTGLFGYYGHGCDETLETLIY